MRPLLAFLVLTFATAALAAGTPSVSEPWVRFVPGSSNAAGYVTLTSPVNDALTVADSECCDRVEIHEMKMEGAVMKMREVEEVALPANTPVTFAPMGYHLMLIGLEEEPGHAIPITLTFASGSTATVDFPVKRVGDNDHKGHH